MGIICGPVALVLLPPGSFSQVVSEEAVWVPCFVSMTAYFVGTSVVFRVLAQSDASRLSPLLGLKVIALAIIVSLLPGQKLENVQWLAVGLCAVAALVLQSGGSGLPWSSLCLLFIGCTFFAIADLGIVTLVEGLQQTLPVSRLMGGNLAMTLTYALSGVVVLPFALREVLRRPFTPTDLRAATEYSIAWLAAMVALYACIGAVGVVFSTILQSTRGILSIAIGAGLARRGWHELEARATSEALVKRVTAAILMTTAIAIYVM